MIQGGANIPYYEPDWHRYVDIQYAPRPDYDTKVKDEKYDIECSRHYLGTIIPGYMDFTRICAAVNEGFAAGRLWGLAPDIQGFLKDTGQNTSRPALSYPLFTPMLARMLGILSQVDVHARAEAISSRAESRRELAIQKARVLARQMAAGPMVANGIAAMGISPDEDAAAAMADDNFRDDVIETITDFMAVLSKRMKVDELRTELGQSASLSGIAATHCYFSGGHAQVEPITCDELVWDISARRRDRSDATFVGLVKTRDIADLMETYSPHRDVLKALDEAARRNDQRGGSGTNGWLMGKPQEYLVYFRDGDYVERGFIEGPNGPQMVTVGEIDTMTGKPRYTEADLIDPPNIPETRDWKGKTQKKWVQYLRYCSFLPREIVPKVTLNDVEYGKDDIVLASGKYEWGEVDPSQENGVKFPIKQCSWMNIRGRTIAPMTAAQTPQRMMSIIASDFTHRIGRASGRSVVFDKSALAGGGMTVKQAAIALKESNPIQIDGMRMGNISNAIGFVGEGLDDNVFKELDILSSMKEIAESLTHLNDQNFGASGSANELVGVKRLQWQQVSIAQQPYTETITSVFKQTYDWIANVARKYYMAHPWTLEDIVGEKGMKVMQAIEDLYIEQVKVDVKLSPDSATVRQSVDEMVMTQWLPLQLIDRAGAAEILGDSTMERAFNVMKTFTKDSVAASQKQAEAEMMAAPIARAEARDQELALQQNDLFSQGMELATKADATNAKSEMPFNAAIADHMKPEANAGQPTQ